MNFFTRELWDRVSNATDEDQLEVEKEWNENCRLYKKQFDELKNLLSKEFLEKYSENGEFHDFSITRIEIVKSESNLMPFVDLKIGIDDGEKKYVIHYTSIKNLVISGKFDSGEIEYLSKREGVIDSWGYDEFQISHDNLLEHEILFLSGSSVKVQFNDIRIIDETLIK